MNERGDHMKTNSDHFQIQKWMLQTLDLKKKKKKRSFVWFSYLLFELWSLNYPKKCICCNFVLTSARNKSVRAIYTYASESSHYTLSENDMVYRGLSHHYKILATKISKRYWLSRNLTKFFNFKSLYLWNSKS